MLSAARGDAMTWKWPYEISASIRNHRRMLEIKEASSARRQNDEMRRIVLPMRHDLHAAAADIVSAPLAENEINSVKSAFLMAAHAMASAALPRHERMSDKPNANAIMMLSMFHY